MDNFSTYCITGKDDTFAISDIISRHHNIGKRVVQLKTSKALCDNFVQVLAVVLWPFQRLKQLLQPVQWLAVHSTAKQSRI